jgi:energy-coupling factor transport system substrate-specific component
MKKSRLLLALVFLIGLAAVFIPVFCMNNPGSFINWGLAATVIAVLSIAIVFYDFSLSANGSKEIALVAMLGAMSAVLRIPFAAIPNVQPCTSLIICAGYVLGPSAGFMVGALTALVSNFFLGQGPWTPFQMLAWGFIGVAAAYLRSLNLGRAGLVIVGILAGYVYGWLTNIWYWASFIYPLTWKTFLATQLTSVWFDTFHALGNALFLGLFGIRFINILERFKLKSNWRRVRL